MLDNVRRFYRKAYRASSDILLIYTNLGHSRNSVPNVELLWKNVQKDFPNIHPKNVFLVWKTTFPYEIGLIVSVDGQSFEETLKSKYDLLPSNVEFKIRRVMSCNLGKVCKVYCIEDGEAPYVHFMYARSENPSNTMDVYFTLLEEVEKDNPELADDNIFVYSATRHMNEITLSFVKPEDGCDMDQVRADYELQSPWKKFIE